MPPPCSNTGGILPAGLLMRPHAKGTLAPGLSVDALSYHIRVRAASTGSDLRARAQGPLPSGRLEQWICYA